MEGFRSPFKRSYRGTFHKHLDRYVREFPGRQDIRDMDTIDMMAVLARGIVSKRLRYRDLIVDNGLPSGAWSAWTKKRPATLTLPYSVSSDSIPGCGLSPYEGAVALPKPFSSFWYSYTGIGNASEGAAIGLCSGWLSS